MRALSTPVRHWTGLSDQGIRQEIDGIQEETKLPLLVDDMVLCGKPGRNPQK